MKVKKWKKLLAVMISVAMFSTSLSGFAAKEIKSDTESKAVSQEELDGYLFAYFTGESEEIRFAASLDGYHFQPLNENKPVITQTQGTGGARDPYIIRGKDGYVYLIATDLKVSSAGTPWGKNDSIVTWRSKDLINWENETILKIRGEYPNTSHENQYKVWAPEAIYDEERDEFMVFWSMEGGALGDELILWYAYTKDFTELTTEPAVLYNPGSNEGGLGLPPVGGDSHCIDGNIMEHNGKYYLYYKFGSKSSAGTQLAVSENLTGPYLPYNESNPNELVSPPYVEGSDVYKLIDQDKWVMIYDFNWSKYYGASESTDLVNWTTLEESKIELNFGGTDTSKNPKHGYVIPITAKEYDAVVGKWGIEEDVSYVEDPYPDSPEGSHETPILFYNFENSNITGTTVKDISGAGDTYDGTLQGGGCSTSSQTIRDEVSDALYLNGSSSYLEFPRGMFDDLNTFTISMDLKSEMGNGNFFTFAVGDSTVTPSESVGKYLFMRTRSTSQYVGMTVNGYKSEAGMTATTSSIQNKWTNLKIVVKPDRMNLYQDGVLIAYNMELPNTMSDLGSNLSAYLGKSFFSPDSYFKGYYDNVKIYDRALKASEIGEEFGIIQEDEDELTVKDVTVTGGHIIAKEIDQEAHAIKLYISKSNSVRTNLKRAQLNFFLYTGSALDKGGKTLFDIENGDTVNITSGLNQAAAEWTIQGILCNNPVLPNQFADPDIDMFNGKYYIYPTTDGYADWGGWEFRVFSSTDMVNWEDEGVFLDLKATESYKNEKGIDVATVPWATGNGWAPTIEEKNGKYYFYFSGNIGNGTKAIGVAVADNPAGPFTVRETPLMTIEDCKAAGVGLTQVIDPSIYTEDGTSYMLFGNGGNTPAIVELTEDMMDWVPGTLKAYSGATGFREAITVTKRDGIYHFTWSQDDTGSENYQVNYGTSDNLYGPITYKYPILQKDPSKDILGTGHHSILYIPERDEYYIAYHRFLTPLGQYPGDKRGIHRETCIDKLEFGSDGFMKKVTPTLEGITEPLYIEEPGPNEDEKAAKEVMDLISNIETVTLESKTAIEEARKAYNALSNVQKDLVTNLAVLEKAEAAYEELKKQEIDEAAAKKVRDMITGIGTVTAGSGAAIEAAEKAYDALTKDQKDLVNNYQVLKDAREAYKKLTENLNPPTEKTKVPAKGSKHAKGKYVYKVTKSSDKNGTVQLVKPKSKNMTKVKVPATVKIKGYKFKVTSIASKAFKKNKKLKTVTIGQNVKDIGKQAFANCTKLNNITVKSTGVKTVGANAFKGISPKAKIKVPAKKFKKYQKKFAGKGQKKTVKIIKK